MTLGFTPEAALSDGRSAAKTTSGRMTETIADTFMNADQ